MNNFAVSVIPFLTARTFNPVFAVHCSVNCCVIVDLKTVVTLHVLKEHRMTALTEGGSLTVFHLDRLEDSGQNLLRLLLIYQQNTKIVLAFAFYLHNLSWDQPKRTKRIKTLIRDFWDVLN